MFLTAATLLMTIAQAVPKQPDGVTPIVPVKTLMAFVQRENPQLNTEAVNQNSNLTHDVGLFQINSANFQRLGITEADARNPIKATKAAAILISQDYTTCLIQYEGEAAVDCMASRYNTGSPVAGLHNGYVAKYRAALNGPTAQPPPVKPIRAIDSVPIHINNTGYR